MRLQLTRLGGILILAGLARIIYAVLIWTPTFQSPHDSMANMYIRSAYGIIVGQGYVQYLPGSSSYNDINTKVIDPAIETGRYPALSKEELSEEGLYPETLHPPGWSILAAGATMLTRIPVWYIMQVITILIDLLGLIVFFHLLKELNFNRRITTFALIFYAIFPPLLFITVNVRPEGFMSFFILSITLLFLRYYKTRAWKQLLYGGLVTGVMCYFRPDFLLYLPFLCLIFTGELLRNFSIKNSLLYVARPVFALLIALMVLIPWGLRNYQQFGKWIFTSSGAGCTLVTGLGTYANPWGFGPSDHDRNTEAIDAGFKHAFDIEANQFFVDTFKESISEHPLAYIGILFKRLAQPIATPYTWGVKRGKGVSITNTRSIGGSLLSKPIFLLRHYWTDLISAGLMFLGLVGIVLFFLAEKISSPILWLLLLSYGYAVSSHVLIHMAPYYLIPTIFTQIIGLSVFFSWILNLRKGTDQLPYLQK